MESRYSPPLYYTVPELPEKISPILLQSSMDNFLFSSSEPLNPSAPTPVIFKHILKDRRLVGMIGSRETINSRKPHECYRFYYHVS